MRVELHTMCDIIFLSEEGTEENMHNLIMKIMQRRAALFFVPIFSLCVFWNVFFNDGNLINAFAVDVSDYYKENLRFDDEGNLLMTTHDLKATTQITYRTIGWVIKRYDMPITAKGQQYAIVPLRKYSDIEYKDDPDDDKYVYCYYYGDKEQLLNAIEKADVTWKKQLENYGDNVYIDEIMTVCEKGVPKGSLSSSGKASGEVYYTYDGIAGARRWASPQSLKTHFDKTVKFPALVHTKKYYKQVEQENINTYSNANTGTFHIEHGSKDNSLYDVSKGVPSGQRLYLAGNIGKNIFNIAVNKVSINFEIPVKITTTYHLKWKDYYGNMKTENKRVARWYIVKRKAEYYKIDKFDYKYLIGVKLSNKALINEGECYEFDYNPEVDYRTTSGYKQPDKLYELEVDGGELRGDNGIKPVIPDENQSSKAEAAVGNIKTQNDYLKYNQSVILDNSGNEYSNHIEKLFMKNEMNLYRDNLMISPMAKNWSGYRTDVTSIYMDKGGKTSEFAQRINDIAVLTPVACKGNVSDDKEHNQCVTPDKERSSLTIGRTFYLGIGTTGTHNNWKGYGTRDYGEYACMTQIKVPFDVFRAGQRVKANTWMDVDNGIVPVAIPFGTKEGKYTIRYRAVAYNAPNVEGYESLTEQGTNKSYSKYVATDSIEVKVVGRIHNLTLGNDEYKVGVRDCDGTKRGCKNQLPYFIDKAQDIPLQITTDGDYYDKTDTVNVNIKYYYLNSKGKRVRLKVFSMEENADGKCMLTKVPNIVIDSKNRIFEGEGMKYKVQDANVAKKSRQVWQGVLHIPENICFVKYKSTLEEGVADKSLINKEKIEGTIIINFDILAKKDGKKILSYINSDNSINGYCNMWKIEEGISKVEIDGRVVDLKCGDSVIFSKSGYKPAFEVVGTH